ncbi:hypothetical protein H6G06_19530 [Anabaena sphaerica FACHB-251]|uniref:Uncharacterized protein n=1 Tax=Anabaena sphaerica FACHB-251 TaxID=2692883 RepID=A0A926WKV2_9NOST|nr:hypothetical protein [Anabaena sphaerica]MBD2295604.1 hypothetical protein [Anabaena sphaerica FACHB-251]
MDSHQQRKKDLEEHLKEDYSLLKELEDDLRLTEESKPKIKLKKQIKEVKTRIDEYTNELNALPNSLIEPDLLANAMTSITFYELDIVIKAMITFQANPAPPETNFALTNPTEKIAKNRFTNHVLLPLNMGMSQVWEVHSLVNIYASRDSSFPERLKAVFIQEYDRLISKGISGDALFDALCKFSSGNSTDIKLISAGLALITYLFWKCEVFER